MINLSGATRKLVKTDQSFQFDGRQAKMNEEERFKLIRAEIHTEYDLIANRMNWYVTSQSFLVTAFALSGDDRHHYMWFLR